MTDEFIQFPLRMRISERRRIKMFAAARDTSAKKVIMRAVERTIREAEAEDRANPARSLTGASG